MDGTYKHTISILKLTGIQELTVKLKRVLDINRINTHVWRNQRETNRMLYILHSSVKVYYYGNIKADSNVHNTMHLLLQKIYVKLFYHHDGINLILHETA